MGSEMCIRDRRGVLFEYQIKSIYNSKSCTIKFNELVIPAGGNKFNCYKEGVEQQTMSYDLDQLDNAHEIWQVATGRSNARVFEEALKIRNQNAEVVDGDCVVDLTDIEDKFQKEGRGPHLLEIDFEPVEEAPFDLSLIHI